MKGHRRVEGRTQQRGKPKVRTGRALDLRGIPTSSIFFFSFSFSAVSLGEPQKSSFILSFECDFCQEYQSGLPFPSPGGHPQTKDWTQVSHFAGKFFTVWATRKAQECLKDPYKITLWRFHFRNSRHFVRRPMRHLKSRPRALWSRTSPRTDLHLAD